VTTEHRKENACKEEDGGNTEAKHRQNSTIGGSLVNFPFVRHLLMLHQGIESQYAWWSLGLLLGPHSRSPEIPHQSTKRGEESKFLFMVLVQSTGSCQI
jgi:hypothetical protein